MIYIPIKQNIFTREIIAEMIPMSLPKLRKSIALISEKGIRIERGNIPSGQLIKILEEMDFKWEYEDKVNTLKNKSEQKSNETE